MRLLIYLQVLLAAFLINHNPLNAQNQFSKLHYYGAALGVEMGIVNQYEIAPMVGYRIIPRWDAGIGIKYQYYNSRRLNDMFSAHLYAPLMFTDFIIIRDLDDFLPFSFIEGSFFFHAQVDYFYLPANFDPDRENTGNNNRFFRPTWLTGAGIRWATGPNGFFQFLIMADISDHNRSIYSSPVIRFGLYF